MGQEIPKNFSRQACPERSRRDAKAQSDVPCHFDPFGGAQDKLREKSFLDPSHPHGMTGLSPSLGVLCVFARVIILPVLAIQKFLSAFPLRRPLLNKGLRPCLGIFG